MAIYQRGSVKLFFKGDPSLQWYFPLYSNLIDYSKNRNFTIVGGAPKYDLSGIRYGHKSTYFDGNVKINISENFSYSDFTQLCWFKVNQYNTNFRMFFQFGGGSDNNNKISLGISNSDDINNAGKIFFGAWFSSDYYKYSPRRYDDNKWHFVVHVRRGNNHLGYIDGSLVVSGYIPTTIANYGQEAIGYNRYYNNQIMIGYLSEVSLFSRALSYQEIKSYYQWATEKRKLFFFDIIRLPRRSLLKR